jgi:hypothetical protein
MEPAGSLLCLQEPTSGPCPNQLSKILTTLSILLLSSNLHLSLTSGLFSSGFRNIILYTLLYWSTAFHFWDFVLLLMKISELANRSTNQVRLSPPNVLIELNQT